MSMARAFTLIETLVVVAVTSLLVAILLPSLGSSRRVARAAQCLSNLRQLAIYSDDYATTYRGWMPRSQHSSFAHRVSAWAYAFYTTITGEEYAGHDERWLAVFNGPYRCPIDRRRTRWSYGYNVYFELASDETHGRTWTRQDDATTPARTVLFGELSDATTADHAMAHFWTEFDAPPEIDASRHGRTCGAAYADGHAAESSFSATFDRSLGINLWNPATAR